MRLNACSLALCFTLLGVSGSSAQGRLPVPSLHLALGFGVDTTASPRREIFDLWQAYLTEPSDSLRVELWSTAERADGRHYDLISPYVYQGLHDFTVVDIAPAVGLPHTFVIRTLVTALDESSHDVRPLALYRVYASQEGGKWVLANALPRTTRDWRRRTIGRVTFVHPGTHEFAVRLGKASSAFVDSLARAFGLPESRPITYYFTDDLGETLRALGLEFFPFGGDAVGGRSDIYARNVYVGREINGEGYLHELAHIVLAPEVGSSAAVLVEGLVTWTGGSAGLGYAELVPLLGRYLSDHPDLTLENVLRNPPPRLGRLDVGYVGAAVLCELVFDRRGLSGLRTLLSVGKDPGAILSAASELLGARGADLDLMWRKACGAG